ncbi:Hin recombinase [Actinocrinis puniceicyclus]|uniref:Hin recombinase n=1 Tax=Actinocrinis puniceicyclus TaxID=977794 RepID=A0A8J8BF87_9ACTN|nr:helix-turn-helix domain-containing protein [Actinocrinis puniceicyclus]MBS2965931.1 Hin recombinase [Actinocrinis puniceicyclus]
MSQKLDKHPESLTSRPWGKKPKLSDKQQRELRRMHGTGEYTIADLAEVFSVSRPTVYRVLQRVPAQNGAAGETGSRA